MRVWMTSWLVFFLGRYVCENLDDKCVCCALICFSNVPFSLFLSSDRPRYANRICVRTLSVISPCADTFPHFLPVHNVSTLFQPFFYPPPPPKKTSSFPSMHAESFPSPPPFPHPRFTISFIIPQRRLPLCQLSLLLHSPPHPAAIARSHCLPNPSSHHLYALYR